MTESNPARRLLHWLKTLPAWRTLIVMVVVLFLAVQAVNLWAQATVDNEDCLVTAADDC